MASLVAAPERADVSLVQSDVVQRLLTLALSASSVGKKNDEYRESFYGRNVMKSMCASYSSNNNPYKPKTRDVATNMYSDQLNEEQHKQRQQQEFSTDRNDFFANSSYDENLETECTIKLVLDKIIITINYLFLDCLFVSYFFPLQI